MRNAVLGGDLQTLPAHVTIGRLSRISGCPGYCGLARRRGNSSQPGTSGKLAYGSNEKAGAAPLRPPSLHPIEQQPANLAALTHQLQKIAVTANGSPTMTIRPCRQVDFNTVHTIIDDAAEAYRA